MTRITPEDLEKTLTEVNKYLRIVEAALRQANRLMREMLERSERRPNVRVIHGSLDEAYNREEMPRFEVD